MKDLKILSEITTRYGNRNVNELEFSSPEDFKKYKAKHKMRPGTVVKVAGKDKKVGDVDTWPGKLDGIPFYVFSMKEPDYVMSIMSTYGTCNVTDSSTKRIYKNENNEEVSVYFNYTEVFHNHYKFRHAVDDNNNNRMQPISIEET